MSPRFINIDPEKMRQEMELVGHEWADRHAAASLLEECEKAVLSEIEVDYRRRFRTGTEAAVLAKADPRYRDHIKSMCEARRLSNRSRVSFDSLKAQYELIRTQASTERAAMAMR